MRIANPASPKTSWNILMEKQQQAMPENGEEQSTEHQTDGRDRMALIGPWVVFLTVVFIWSFY